MVRHKITSRKRRALAAVTATLLLAVLTDSAPAAQLQDMVRIKGAESSKLIGMGLVLGLSGTGDGDGSRTTMRRLAAMMNRLGDPVVTPDELDDAENVAVVYLSAEVPAGGVREGDHVDVHVAAPTAESLQGGRLVMTPMLGPIPGSPIYAYAEGPITIEDDDANRTGVVERGGVLTRDVYARYLDDDGRMTLVIDQVNATWPMATTLATLVNDLMNPGGQPIAMALDQKNVVVQVPTAAQQNPGAFISQILEIQIDPTMVRTGARVVVNEKTGTIVMTGDVEISPVVISHKGMTITAITPPPNPTPAQPIIEEQPFVANDPGRRGGSRLADLMAAFNQLKVPAEDRIAILKEIHRSGKLHAQLILED